MANVLNTDKRIAVIAALAEGSSIRSIERITACIGIPSCGLASGMRAARSPALSPITAVRLAIAQE